MSTLSAAAIEPSKGLDTMEHLFHIFIPGTPENMGLIQVLPMLAPVQHHLALMVSSVARFVRAKGSR